MPKTKKGTTTKKAKTVEEPIEDAKYVDIIEEQPEAKLSGVKEVKDIIIDPALDMHKFANKSVSGRDAYVAQASEDFTADGVKYQASKYYILVTSDNKTFIVSKDFFDRFFVVMHSVSQ